MAGWIFRNKIAEDKQEEVATMKLCSNAIDITTNVPLSEIIQSIQEAAQNYIHLSDFKVYIIDSWPSSRCKTRHTSILDIQG